MQSVTLKFETQNYRIKEAFNTLRTNIDLAGVDVKVVCITSATPSEGKSSTSFDLAKAYAQDGKKVLLIDADMRKSVLKEKGHAYDVTFGLSTFLAGKSPLKETMCSTDVPNFYVMFAGPVPPNPSELLGSDRFAHLIKVARESFDMVIIDTPPLGNVIDTAVIAKQCDGAILVIKYKGISRKFISQVKKQLTSTGCKILGAVLTMVDMSGNSYYGKYYGKYYGNENK